MDRAFDVVVVPDFTGKNASGFEMRTLFFLASWIENAGQARDFPLHLVCIGEPPPSVRWLAAESDASITVHQPMNIDLLGFSNKLRGFEIQNKTDQILLLDADIFVLSDISDLSDLGHCIAAAPAGKPRVPKQYWRRIYDALGMEMPTERIASIRGELGCPLFAQRIYDGQESELSAMLPYYNGGVLFAPWDCGLREVWGEHICRIVALFKGKDEAFFAVENDMAGLATTIEHFKRQGIPFVQLPACFNARYLHLYKSALSLSEIKLYHAIGFGRSLPLNSVSFNRSIYGYREHLISALLREWYREYGIAKGIRTIGRSLFSPMRDAMRLVNQVHRLCKRHVMEALQHGVGRDRLPVKREM